MNMISTGAFLPETDASTKQNELVKKLTAAWEKKNSKTARAGGASLMALSLAACGGEDNTPFSAADVSAAEAAATTAALTGADGTVYASVDAAVTSNDTAIADAARAEGVASVDITTDNQAAIDAAVAAVESATGKGSAEPIGVAAINRCAVRNCSARCCGRNRAHHLFHLHFLWQTACERCQIGLCPFAGVSRSSSHARQTSRRGF